MDDRERCAQTALDLKEILVTIRMYRHEQTAIDEVIQILNSYSQDDQLLPATQEWPVGTINPQQ